MSKPFEVGDAVVFNPEYVEFVPGMQIASSFTGEVIFPYDAKMIVIDIQPDSTGLSGWTVAVALQGDDDGLGEMYGWDSEWFKKGDS